MVKTIAYMVYNKIDINLTLVKISFLTYTRILKPWFGGDFKHKVSYFLRTMNRVFTSIFLVRLYMSFQITWKLHWTSPSNHVTTRMMLQATKTFVDYYTKNLVHKTFILRFESSYRDDLSMVMSN